MRSGSGWRLCGWCLLGIAVEAGLYFSYRGHDARFHWFTHFFVGSGLALIGMALFVIVRGRPAPYPLGWLVAGHLFAMFPDLLFIGGVAHAPWMDVFAGHISSHFVPGRNLTWYLFFVACLALYLWQIRRARHGPYARPRDLER